MVRKKVDNRVRTLISNGVKLRHRTMFVLIGDKGRDQVVNLHFMLSKASVRTQPSVLWCYKKDLGFSSHRKKRAKKLKRDVQRGIRNVDEENPFELFIGATDIRYAYYKDSHKILGQTFGMLVLQDFEALTPNLLARTLETVEGGGLVVLLLKNMTSLKQLYAMSMDVHSRFRTESHQDVVPRFNERFTLSLGSCQACLVVDDELNVLPISSHVRNVQPIQLSEERLNARGDFISEAEAELNELKEAMKDTPPVGLLVQQARTLDQAKAVLTFVEAISEKSLRSTCVLTAARGRGKSAALGLAMAGAIAYGYSNIFLTAPSPENLGTVFEMLFKGFDALGFHEHKDYQIVQSTNPNFNKAIVRVNVFREHRQTVQFIQPTDHKRLTQAELLVIDEAAAIPLPIVKNLLGPYLVFMSSTVNGYEGTGRALSLKLVKQLRQQSSTSTSASASSASAAAAAAASGASAKGAAAAAAAALDPSVARSLREVTLEEPIRYAYGDKVEAWLNKLLCLDCERNNPRVGGALPHPSKCTLYQVDRDALFSFHKASEALLQRMMALYVSSHYKNTPNDLQLMSDAPAHRLFILLGPTSPTATQLPDLLAVVQVCLEGQVSRESVLKQLARGVRSAGDLIPWCISSQFQNSEFGALSGARVVRIAVHPDLPRMGYASRALELLSQYYAGNMMGDVGKHRPSSPSSSSSSSSASSSKPASPAPPSAKAPGLLRELVAPRALKTSLLLDLEDCMPERLDWLGVSFGLTQPLFNFWSKAGYRPVYLRQANNLLTGEHTCVMIKPQQGVALQTVADGDWLGSFAGDFRKRLVFLLGYSFKHFPCGLALSFFPDAINHAARPPPPAGGEAAISYPELLHLVSEYDLKRLESYASNLVDYGMILDLVPILGQLFFSCRLGVSLSHTQAALLLAVGLQHKTVKELEQELRLSSTQLLALFNKAVRRLSQYLRSLEEKHVKHGLQQQPTPPSAAKGGKVINQSLSAELKEKGGQVQQELRAKQRQMLQTLSLAQYEVAGDDAAWQAALSKGKAPGSVSIEQSAEKAQSMLEQQEQELQRKKDKKDRKKGRKRSLGGAGAKGGGGTPRGSKGNKKYKTPKKP